MEPIVIRFQTKRVTHSSLQRRTGHQSILEHSKGERQLVLPMHVVMVVRDRDNRGTGRK